MERVISKQEIILWIIVFIGIGYIVLSDFGFSNPYEIPKIDCDNICLESDDDGLYSIKQIDNISNTSRYCNIKNCEQINGGYYGR